MEGCLKGWYCALKRELDQGGGGNGVIEIMTMTAMGPEHNQQNKHVMTNRNKSLRECWWENGVKVWGYLHLMMGMLKKCGLQEHGFMMVVPAAHDMGSNSNCRDTPQDMKNFPMDLLLLKSTCF